MKFENHDNRAASVFSSCSVDVSIQIKNGTAVITGKVCSFEDKVKAETAVKHMPDIDRVINMVKTG